MSQPSFPQNANFTREDVVNQILSSIAMEELGLSHIINAEGEKLQYILGTLPGLTGPAATIEDLLDANASVQSLLQSASYNQLFLKSKMQQVLSSSELTGATGPTGPTGPAGDPGGPTGAVGPTGFNTTATSAFAYASATALTAAVGGTPVALPSGQILPTGITVDGANTTFTVSQSGLYRISYALNTTAALLLSTRLMINGVANTASTVAPLISLSNYSNEILLNITAPTTVQLQVLGASLNLTLVTGAGATLMIQRLS